MRLSQQDIDIELSETETLQMDQRRNNFEGAPASEPLLNHEQEDENNEDLDGDNDQSRHDADGHPFSWVAYSVSLLLGIAMLWAWNMFLAAAPYFQRRFKGDSWILNHFQAAEISVATSTALGTMLVLTFLQQSASYPRRIVTSLLINIILFTVLAVSTYIRAKAREYFAFLLLVILLVNVGAAFMQNGLFSFIAGFGRKEYTQAIMTGQAIAGVMPPLVQILSVAARPAESGGSEETGQSSKSAFIYFITASAVSGVTLIAFFDLLRRKARSDALYPDTANKPQSSQDVVPDDNAVIRKSIPMMRLMKKVPLLALSIILCFSVTMVFPVFTTVVVSNNGIDPAIFIPLAFLIWNIGDLLGRLITLFPTVLLTHYPFALFCLAMARLLFIPLYFLCNIKGRGAVVSSDTFYLVIVQLLFGITNGYLGTNCMMGAGDWVASDEREAVGGFMALCLITGLTIGSFLSFLLGDI